jgi:hypothetical protein
MMINKANSDSEAGAPSVPESGYVDVAKVDVQCHLLIKDKDTGEILVNKRG